MMYVYAPGSVNAFEDDDQFTDTTYWQLLIIPFVYNSNYKLSINYIIFPIEVHTKSLPLCYILICEMFSLDNSYILTYLLIIYSCIYLLPIYIFYTSFFC